MKKLLALILLVATPAIWTAAGPRPEEEVAQRSVGDLVKGKTKTDLVHERIARYQSMTTNRFLEKCRQDIHVYLAHKGITSLDGITGLANLFQYPKKLVNVTVHLEGNPIESWDIDESNLNDDVELSIAGD